MAHTLTNRELYDAVQTLNWCYGRGDLRGDSAIQQAANGDYVCVASLQYGFSKFTVRVVGRTVYARGHQLTVPASAQPSPTISNASQSAPAPSIIPDSRPASKLTNVEAAAVKLGNLPAEFSEMDRVSSPAYRKAERAVAKETARRQR